MKKLKKVVWISSYLPRSCGIAFYSAQYISAINEYAKKTNKKISIKVISHLDASKADYPIIDLKEGDWHHKVFKIIKEEKPDIVHIQHEYGLYETYGDGNKRIIELIEMLKSAGFPVIMTYHSVYKKMNRFFSNFVSETLKILSAGILHCEYQKKALKKNLGWNPSNVYVLPHGSREDIKLNRKEVREGFGYTDDELVVGSAGLASKRKGFRTLIRQWPKVVKRFPNAILALEMKPHFSKETREYINEVLEMVIESPVMHNIELTVRDYSSMEFYRKLTSFDVLVLPYRSESQSGVLAHGFSVGAPAVVSNIEGLGAEIKNSKAGIAVKNRQHFYRAIIKMLSSKRLRERYSKNALKYVKNVNGWDIIAKKTLAIYRKFLH